jgi:hypothetical protein
MERTWRARLLVLKRERSVTCTAVGAGRRRLCPWLVGVAGEDNRREGREEKVFIRLPPFRPGTRATGSAGCRASRVLLVVVTEMPLNVACVLWVRDSILTDGFWTYTAGVGSGRTLRKGIWAVWATLMDFNLSPMGIIGY